MYELIEAITEGNWEFKDNVYSLTSSYGGYVIKTFNQKIKVGIENQSSCCEQFGYFTSEDDLQTFVGAHLTDIKIVDTELKVKSVEEHIGEYGIDSGGIMFVNFETTKGTFQLVAYNAHNGYYGHNAVVISEKLNHEVYL